MHIVGYIKNYYNFYVPDFKITPQTSSVIQRKHPAINRNRKFINELSP